MNKIVLQVLLLASVVLLAGSTAGNAAGAATGFPMSLSKAGDIQPAAEQTATAGAVIDTLTRSISENSVGSSFANIGSSSQITFFTVAGAANTDDGLATDRTADGGAIAVGATDSFGVGGELLLTKYDASGLLDWAATLGGPLSDGGKDVHQTEDGGYIVVGGTESFGAGAMDVFLVKFDSAGTVEWAKTAGGPGYDYGNAVEQTADGGYIVIAQTNSFGAGGMDGLLLKYDASGALTWARTVGGANDENCLAVQQTTDQGYIVTGGTKSFGAGNADVILIKFDASGTVEWAKTAGGINAEVGFSVLQDAGGEYVVAGGTQSFGAGSADVIVLKYSSAGALDWATTAGGINADIDYSIQQAVDGSYVAAGYTGSFGAGSYDLFIQDFNANGGLSWARTAGGINIDVCYSVRLAADGGYLFTGITQSYGAGNDDVFLLKTDSNGFNTGCPAVASCSPSSSSPSITVGSASLLTSTPMISDQFQAITSTLVSLASVAACSSACELGVEVLMPSHQFTAGDPCSLTALLCNPGPLALSDLSLYVFLDTGSGDYWFAPSWVQYPPDVDSFDIISLPVGATELSVLPVFNWPSGAAGLSGLTFYSAITDVAVTHVVGNLGSWTFSSY